MRHVSRTALAALASGLALLAGTNPAHGQADGSPWSVEARGGITVPAGDLADLPIDDVGPSVGLGVRYHLDPQVALRVDGGYETFAGESRQGGAAAPDVSLWHYDAGIEARLLEPGESPWNVAASAGAGATTWDTDAFTVPGGGSSGGLSETYFTANGGLEASYSATDDVRLIFGGQWYLQFTDEQDTRPLSELSPELEGGFDSASTLPFYAGVELTL